MQELVLTKHIVVFQISPKTHKKQFISMWTGPLLDIQYANVSKQFRGKNQYVHCREEKKKHIPSKFEHWK